MKLRSVNYFMCNNRAFSAYAHTKNVVKCLFLSRVLQNTPTLGQQGRFDLASEIAKTTPRLLVSRVNKLGLTQENRGKIAEIAATVNYSAVRNAIKNFDLPNHAASLYTLAEIGIQNDPFATEIPLAEYLNSSQLAALSNLKFALRLKKVKESIIQSPSPHTELAKYDLSESGRFEIAQGVVKRTDLNDLADFPIESYRLSPQDTLALVKQIIAKNPYISDLKTEILLFGPNGRIGVDLSTLHQRLQPILLMAEMCRFEDAKKEANEEDFDPAKYRLNNLHQYEIAKHILETASHPETFEIKRYILNEAQKLELGKISIRRAPLLTDIQKFAPKTSPEHALLSVLAEDLKMGLAKKDLSNDPIHFSIRKYKLDSQIHRLELAKASIKAHPENAKKIREFDLGEKERLKIAQTLATSNGEILSQYIQSFDFGSEEQLFMLAAIALQNNPNAGKHIPKYGITNPKFLDALLLLVKMEGSNKRKESSPLSGNTAQELSDKRKKLRTLIQKLQTLKSNAGAIGGEKTNSDQLIREKEAELKEVEAEIKRRKMPL